MLDLKKLEQKRTERRRGWILYLLYKARPHPMELLTLMELLDAANFPVTRRKLAEELDYLRSLRLVRVFPTGAEAELDEVKQAKAIQRYAECESDEEMRQVLCARLTAAGINFQEGLEVLTGLQRVQ
jgi:hypothetical protein